MRTRWGAQAVKLRGKDIEIVVKGEAICLEGDEYLLKIMISNMLDNAIKACGEKGRISIMTHRMGECIVLEIEDNGIGIPKESVAHILEPFYVVDKSRSRKNNGAGLGLSICQRIAQIHGARIYIESELKRGTNVKVIFE